MAKTVFFGIIGALLWMGAAESMAADGKAVYDQACALCHNNLPPKLGDKAAWEPRLKQGTDALVAAVVKGKGTMPPRAGKSSLTDADIKAAVEYMQAQVK
jgi:cytochrome c5